jgi:uncharacterized membrane protein (DUF441 family)
MPIVRIPVLIALLFASGPLQWRYINTRFTLEESLPSWFALVALAVVFLVAVAYGRDQHHARPVLAIEAVLGFLLAVVPPLVWLGVAVGSDAAALQTWSRAMGGTSGAAYAQVLALVWMMTAIRTLRAQRR